jgi:ATP synthase protein I
LSNQSPESIPAQAEKLTQESSPSLGSENSMEDYYQLQKTLYLVTIALIGIIYFPVWYFYSLNTALNYLLGAVVGIVYLGLLGKEVERLGQQEQRVGTKGLAVFAILIIVASKWQQLHILPVFLGFLTYKAAILIYMLQTIMNVPDKEDSNG